MIELIIVKNQILFRLIKIINNFEKKDLTFKYPENLFFSSLYKLWRINMVICKLNVAGTINIDNNY